VPCYNNLLMIRSSSQSSLVLRKIFRDSDDAPSEHSGLDI
jgi:hypothetical protein